MYPYIPVCIPVYTHLSGNSLCLMFISLQDSLCMHSKVKNDRKVCVYGIFVVVDQAT